jgi:hypothetical protein
MAMSLGGTILRSRFHVEHGAYLVAGIPLRFQFCGTLQCGLPVDRH